MSFVLACSTNLIGDILFPEAQCALHVCILEPIGLPKGIVLLWYLSSWKSCPCTYQTMSSTFSWTFLVWTPIHPALLCSVFFSHGLWCGTLQITKCIQMRKETTYTPSIVAPPEDIYIITAPHIVGRSGSCGYNMATIEAKIVHLLISSRKKAPISCMVQYTLKHLVPLWRTKSLNNIIFNAIIYQFPSWYLFT